VKIKILYFDTNYNAKLVTAKLKNGKVSIDGKTFVLDVTKPFMLKTLLGYKPFYIVKWSNPKPVQIFPEFENPQEKYFADVIDGLLEKERYKNILTIQRPTLRKFQTIILGALIAGIVIGVFLVQYGVVKI